MKSASPRSEEGPTDDHPEADVRHIVGGVVRRSLQPLPPVLQSEGGIRIGVEAMSPGDKIQGFARGIHMATTSKADRRRAVTRTLASWRIEGFEPDAKYMALLERFVEGEITLAQVRAETRGTVNLQPKAVA
jgi:hypothetical protein